MKHMKKLAGLALALVMLVALSVPAMAVTFVKGTNVNSTSRIETYQIFAGTATDDGKTLSEITWGSHMQDVAKQTGLVTALKKLGTDENVEVLKALKVNENVPDVGTVTASADDVAKALATLSTNQDILNKIANLMKDYVTGTADGAGTTLGDGYYLIVTRDTMGTETPNDDSFAYTLAPSTAADENGNIVVNPKTDKPGLTKTIVKGDSKVDETDAAIGEDVNFELTAKLPVDFESLALQQYELTFHDHQDAGLTLKADTIKLYAKSGDAEVEIPASAYTITTTGLSDGCSFEVHMIVKGTGVASGLTALDLKNSDPITVRYTATLNENANIGSAGTKNTAHLSYTENNNPPKDTPDDTVVVFTFETIVNKKNPEGQSLTGAKFTLYRVDTVNGAPTDVEVGKFETGTESTFTFSGLKAGNYKLVEDEAPTPYNKLENPVYFKIEYEANNADVPELVTLTAYETDENWNKISENITATFTPTVSPEDASVSTDIVNRTGVTLPSTGGIGTTIFYIVGGVLVAAAAILLITKRRMSVNDD